MKRILFVGAAALLSGACAAPSGEIARHDLHWGHGRPHHPAHFETLKARMTAPSTGADESKGRDS